MSTQGQGDVSARLIDAILNKPKRRVNRPDDAESGKRLVGWVIDEADAGMSEALFALEGIEDRLRTLLSSSRGEQGWRTIDSAPKDGTRFLAWGPLWRCPFPAQFPDPVTTMVWIDTCEVQAKGRREYATHWMPLPSAPGSVPTSLAGQGPDAETPSQAEIGNVLTDIMGRRDAELQSMSEDDLRQWWFFRYEPERSLAWNIYSFHDCLKLYGSSCRRWEEMHNGSCCVVERVRDKYLMPKIKEFEQILLQSSPQPTAVAGQVPDGAKEDAAAAYFRSAIADGQAAVLLADLATYDNVLRELGIQESHKHPVDEVRRIQRVAEAAHHQGVETAAKLIDRKVSDYTSEHGSLDPETGAMEFSRSGEEYVSTLEELAEEIRGINTAAPQPTAGGDAPTFDTPKSEPNLEPSNVFSNALSAERARVIEECAMVADQFAAVTEQLEGENSTTAAGIHNVAAAIRALAQQDNGGAGHG